MVRHWRVLLGVVVRGISAVALAAQFLHAGADRGEVVSSSGPVHVCFSMLIIALMAAARPLTLCNMVNISRGVSAPCSGVRLQIT